MKYLALFIGLFICSQAFAETYISNNTFDSSILNTLKSVSTEYYVKTLEHILGQAQLNVATFSTHISVHFLAEHKEAFADCHKKAMMALIDKELSFRMQGDGDVITCQISRTLNIR